MKLVYTVCDMCGKSHGQMREFEGKMIGSLSCWKEFWQREWMNWETQRYQQKLSRGALQFKVDSKTAVNA